MTGEYILGDDPGHPGRGPEPAAGAGGQGGGVRRRWPWPPGRRRRSSPSSPAGPPCRRGARPTLGQPGVLRAVVLGGAGYCLIGLLGVGLGAVVRHTRPPSPCSSAACTSWPSWWPASPPGSCPTCRSPSWPTPSAWSGRRATTRSVPVALGRAGHALPVRRRHPRRRRLAAGQAGRLSGTMPHGQTGQVTPIPPRAAGRGAARPPGCCGAVRPPGPPGAAVLPGRRPLGLCLLPGPVGLRSRPGRGPARPRHDSPGWPRRPPSPRCCCSSCWPPASPAGWARSTAAGRAAARRAGRAAAAAPRPGAVGWLGAGLRDGPGWRAVAYQLLKLPLAVPEAYAAFLWVAGWPT
jgi:hypothetical protein